jgi:hypothetical protein
MLLIVLFIEKQGFFFHNFLFKSLCAKNVSIHKSISLCEKGEKIMGK